MKAKIMKRAWAIARAAAARFGGKASEYIAEALRTAWAESRRPKLVEVELRAPARGYKTWIARIVGTHPVYKLDRRFVNAVEGYTWELEDGIYEVCENGRRYFIRVAAGDWRRIDASEVAA